MHFVIQRNILIGLDFIVRCFAAIGFLGVAVGRTSLGELEC